MKSMIFSLSLLSAAALSLSAAEGRQIYAHYMACWPAGTSAIHHSLGEAHKVRHDSRNLVDAVGGRIVNFPLIPQNRRLTPEESAELEIRRAIRGGLDGFAIDAWAGGDGAKQTLDRLFAAAEKMKVPFYLTICMDPSCHPRNPKEPGNQIDEYIKSIKQLLEKHGKSPNLARRNGKPLIFGYSSAGIFNTAEMKKLPEGPEKWRKIRDAYVKIEQAVGQKLYFHYDFDNDKKSPKKAEWLGSHYDAVGGFLGSNGEWRFDDKLISAIKKGGAEWSMPMWFQYNNKAGSLLAGKGSDILRKNWEQARKTGSTLLQFVTLNDYGEETSLAPGYETNYTILNLNRHLIDWWKQGREPKVDKDVIHVIFRKNMPGSVTYPFRERRTAEGCVEVVTILTAPGKVDVENYGSYEAPAGLFVKQFPMKPGKISAKVKRGLFGSTAVSVTTHEEISDRPFRENNTLACFSSNYDEEWKADFPNDKPLYYSEYGDVDGDGLPNWFEMYWFGKFPFMETASGADPAADPDQDGKTNLQEWKDQSNPLAKQPTYAAGYVWNMDEIHKSGLSWNPDLDTTGHPVWYYMYKHGDVGRIVPDGKYERDPFSGPNVFYAGLMVHLSPHHAPPYRYIHGWIAREKNKYGSFTLKIVPRKQAMQILAWQSPVNGNVALTAQGEFTAGPVDSTFSVMKNGSVLYEKKIGRKEQKEAFNLKFDSIPVRKGDCLYFIGNCSENGAEVKLRNLNIKLNKLEQK